MGSTRNWLGLYTFEEYKHYRKTTKTTARRKKILKTMEYIIPTMGHYPRNG